MQIAHHCLHALIKNMSVNLSSCNIGMTKQLLHNTQVGTMLVGSIRLNAIKAAGAPALILGPLTVEPAFSDRGIGSRLMELAINQARADGHKLIGLKQAEQGHYVLELEKVEE